MDQVSDEGLIKTIGEFIEAGHVENIVAMFRQDPSSYRFCGELLKDERFMVRMGVVLLFEELAPEQPDQVAAAIPYLQPLLTSEEAYVRGEAVTVLTIIDTPEVADLISPLLADPESQIRDIVRDYLAD